jgi:hypothetical protein
MHILALIVGLGISIAALVVGIVSGYPGLLIFAALGFFGTITGYLIGVGKIEARGGTRENPSQPVALWAVFDRLPNWVIAIDAVLLIAGFIVMVTVGKAW